MNQHTEVHDLTRISRASGHRIPIAGKIRPGVQILIGAAKTNEQAKRIYREGCKQGLSFRAIETQIRAQVPELSEARALMAPRNIDYFVARSSDFDNPLAAEEIVKIYGKEVPVGPETRKRLYEFPIVFPTDNLADSIPHRYTCYQGQHLKYWSMVANGKRRCMTFADPEKDAQGMAVRTENGRAIIERQDNGGECQPNKCPEFQRRACHIDGAIVAYVPGIKECGAIAIQTHSVYALKKIEKQLLWVKEMRGAYSGFCNDQPIFKVKKVLQRIAQQDNGQTKMRDQEIITLVQIPDYLSLMHNRAANRAEDAVRALTGNSPESLQDVTDPAIDDPEQICATSESAPDEAPPDDALPGLFGDEDPRATEPDVFGIA